MGKIKGFIGETVIYGFANVFSRMFAMMLIPLYANYLGKIDYSNLVMLQSTFSILTFLLALNSGVFFYYYEYENKKYRKLVFSSWFYYQLIVAIAITILLFIFAKPITTIYITTPNNSETLFYAILLIGGQFFPYIINITNINLFRIDRKPKNVMYITLLEAFFTLTFIGVGLHYFEFGILGVLSSQIVARFIVAILFYKTSLFYINAFYFSKKLLKKLFVFSWPFFIISIFSWIIISIDKFIGADILTNKEDIAILTLAMQLSIPITVLADMIRMAIGPFIMSIRFEKDANKSYQQVFDLSVFTALVVLISLIIVTPIVVPFLADQSYLKVISVIPLIAFASILSLISNQLAICFSLTKQTVFILYATVLGGVFGILINALFMQKYGFIVSGFSQIAAFLIMVTFIYFVGKRRAKLEIKLSSSFKLIAITLLFISILYYNMENILNGEYFPLFLFGCLSIMGLFITYLHSQKISASYIISKILRK